MQTVLIDTDIAIDYLRGVAYSNEFIKGLWKNDIAYLSVLSVYELQAGMRPSEKQATNDFIIACKLEVVNYDIAEKAGELYRNHRKKGITLTTVDCLITATAIIRKHKIATRNKDHYPDKTLLLEVL